MKLYISGLPQDSSNILKAEVYTYKYRDLKLSLTEMLVSMQTKLIRCSAFYCNTLKKYSRIKYLNEKHLNYTG